MGGGLFSHIHRFAARLSVDCSHSRASGFCLAGKVSTRVCPGVGCRDRGLGWPLVSDLRGWIHNFPTWACSGGSVRWDSFLLAQIFIGQWSLITAPKSCWAENMPSATVWTRPIELFRWHWGFRRLQCETATTVKDQVWHMVDLLWDLFLHSVTIFILWEAGVLQIRNRGVAITRVEVDPPVPNMASAYCCFTIKLFGSLTVSTCVLPLAKRNCDFTRGFI